MTRVLAVAGAIVVALLGPLVARSLGVDGFWGRAAAVEAAVLLLYPVAVSNRSQTTMIAWIGAMAVGALVAFAISYVFGLT